MSGIIWNADPLLLKLGPLQIRWYGLLFSIAFLCGYYIFRYISKKEKLPLEWTDTLLIHIVLGVIIGARLGHCLFYDPVYYFTHPIKFLAIWEGGLASHGGVIGILIGSWLFSRRVSKKPFLWLMDRMALIGALGGFFIRLGNLMNSEIIGKPTDLPWGFKFVRTHYGSVARHPSQLYESFFYLFVFFIVSFIFFKTDKKEKHGFIIGVLFILVFTGRFLIEFVKKNQEAFESSMFINMGQILSIPFILFGLYLVISRLRSKKQ